MNECRVFPDFEKMNEIQNAGCLKQRDKDTDRESRIHTHQFQNYPMKVDVGQRAWEKTLGLEQSGRVRWLLVQFWCYKNTFHIQKVFLA